jgi:hypothetical protein
MHEVRGKGWYYIFLPQRTGSHTLAILKAGNLSESTPTPCGIKKYLTFNFFKNKSIKSNRKEWF